MGLGLLVIVYTLSPFDPVFTVVRTIAAHAVVEGFDQLGRSTFEDTTPHFRVELRILIDVDHLLEDGRRLKGPLFDDTAVQKLLKRDLGMYEETDEPC